MATITQHFPATMFSPSAGNAFPELKAAGTNYTEYSFSFDAGVNEFLQVLWRATSYGSGNVTVKVAWYADTASTGDVVWGARMAAITANADTQDVETDTLATENTVTDTHLGTVGQRLHEVDLTLSNLDAVAAGDYCVLQLRRFATDAGDTMAGDAQMVSVTLTYSDV